MVSDHDSNGPLPDGEQDVKPLVSIRVHCNLLLMLTQCSTHLQGSIS